MTSGDFLKLMIQQLQQQDPLNPTDSNQLLTQMSQISTLQSNTQMQQNLQSMTLQQSIGSAGNLIGKMVQGIDESGSNIQGQVTSVKVADKKVRLELDTGNDLPMENVTQVAIASANSATNAATSTNALQQLQQLLNGSGTSNTALQQLLSGSTPGSTTDGTAASSNLATLLGQSQAQQSSAIPSWTSLNTNQLATLTNALKALQGASGS